MARNGYNTYLPLNLSKPLVDEFWEKQDTMTKAILTWMKSAEHWTMDSKPNLEGPLRRLAENLEKSSTHGLRKGLLPLIRAMAYLSTPAALRLLEWMDKRHSQGSGQRFQSVDSDLVGEMLHTAANLREEGSRSRQGPQAVPGALEGMVLLDRLQTLKSISLLRKIFARDRVFHLTQILDEIQENEI